MANNSLINDYSQQYSNLTSEIIAYTAQIPNLSGSLFTLFILYRQFVIKINKYISNMNHMNKQDR